MSKKIVYYCKGTDRMRLCKLCKYNYYRNKEKIDEDLKNNHKEVIKIDDDECYSKNIKYFKYKIFD